MHRLVQLGGEALVRRGDGDDQHKFGLYGDLFPWLDELYNAMLHQFPIPAGVGILDPNQMCVVGCPLEQHCGSSLMFSRHSGLLRGTK
jgi:hypothetical protein